MMMAATVGIAATALVVALGISGVGSTAFRRLAGLEPSEAPAGSSNVRSIDPPVAAPPPAVEEAPAFEIDPNLVFGGRTLPWWRKRLNALHQSGRHGVLTLTIARAERLGLEVSKTSEVYELKPSKALAERIRKRAEP
jgi:hypothetical protein